jgi:transposase
MRKDKEGYPSDVSDEEWALGVSYLTLRDEAAPPREYSLRAVFNARRWMARTGAAWRMMPHDFPPWAAVYQQTQRWLKAGVFEAIGED